MKKISILLLLILFLCMPLLSACGRTIDTEVVPVSVEEVKAAKGVSISFRVRSGVVSQALETLVPEFKKLYPNIEVKVDAVSGGYDDLRKTTVLDISATRAPDLIMGYPDHFAEYYAGGALVDLQTFVDSSLAGIGYTQAELDDFVADYMGENKGFNPDKPNDLYGFPFNKSTEVLVYNETAFKVLFGNKAALTFDINGGESVNTKVAWKEYLKNCGTECLDKVPKTWAEVDAVGQEIIDIIKVSGNVLDRYCEAMGVDAKDLPSKLYADGKFIPFAYDSNDNGFITVCHQWKGAYTERVSIVSGKAKFNNNEVKSGLTYLQDMAKKGTFGIASSWNASYASDAFKTFKCLMTVGSSAGVGYNINTDHQDWYSLGVSTVPYNTEDAKFVIQQGTNIAMLNQNTNLQRTAAWLFVKFLLEPKNTAIFAMDTGGYLPVRTSSYDLDDYKEYLTNPTDDKVEYSKSANTSLNYINNGYTFFVDEAFKGSSNVRDTAGDIFLDIMCPTDNVWANVDNAIKKGLDSLGRAYQ